MTHIVFHEIAWLLPGAAAADIPGVAFRQPVIIPCLIAVRRSPDGQVALAVGLR